MDHNEYLFPEKAEESDRVNEPAMGYSTSEDHFEQDWKRGITIDEFKERLLNKLEFVHG